MSEALSRQLDRLAADETRAARKAALARFAAAGFPSRKIETWHYTDLGVLAARDLTLVPPAPDAELVDEVRAAVAELAIPAEAPTAVFIDGRLVAALSRMNAPGLSVLGLASQPDVLFAEAGIAEDAALASLNAAFAVDGAVIRAGTEGRDPPPLHLVFVGSARTLAPQVRVRIDLEASRRAAVVQHFVDLPGRGAGAVQGQAGAAPEQAGAAWLNLVMDIGLGRGSTLELFRLQAHGGERYHTSLTRALLAEDAVLTAGNVELGGKLVRNELEIALGGPKARAELFGLAIVGGHAHVDNRLAVDHRAPETKSEQDYRAIVADRSRSIFNGKVTVREHAQQIDARQRNDNLLLSPRAEVDTKPELEIYADQVACSHGATVGEISEEQMFYLRARGIDEATARDMLTAAFAEKILTRFGSGWVRERADRLIEGRLPSRRALEERAA